MSDPSSALGPADFLAAFQALLPQGLAWSRDPEAVLTAFLSALAAEKATTHQALVDLLEVEADPRSTSAMLSDWEAAFGLPDTCVTGTQTVQQRRTALLARMTDPGGQSRAYFIALAASLGFTVTIDEFRPFRASVNAAGDACYPTSALFTWRVNAAGLPITSFRAGQSLAGEPLATASDQMLECPIRKRAPAHTTVIFAYPPS